MGGEWDSTNVADGQVAVFTPIALDHDGRLGSTVAEIARTKSGIIKPAAAVVSAIQPTEALAVLRAGRRPHRVDARRRGRRVRRRRVDASPSAASSITIRGLAGEYADLLLPLFGAHQAENAAVADRRGRGVHRRRLGAPRRQVVQRGPRRGDLAGAPAGRRRRADHHRRRGPQPARRRGARRRRSTSTSTSTRWRSCSACSRTRTPRGIVDALAPRGARFVVTAPDRDRAVRGRRSSPTSSPIASAPTRCIVDRGSTTRSTRPARGRPSAPKRAVVVAGSIALVGEAMAIAADRDWGRDGRSGAARPAPERPDDASRIARRRRRARCARASPRSCSASRRSSCSSPRSSIWGLPKASRQRRCRRGRPRGRRRHHRGPDRRRSDCSRHRWACRARLGAAGC